MTKNILVTFDMRIGDYEHSDVALFDEKLSDYGYCKSFWCLSKKLILDNETYWDNPKTPKPRLYDNIYSINKK